MYLHTQTAICSNKSTTSLAAPQGPMTAILIVNLQHYEKDRNVYNALYRYAKKY
jgi:hypothetical protein